MKKRILSLLAGVCLVVFVATAARAAADDFAEGSFNRTLKVTGSADVEVTTGSGGITVHAAGAGEVRVTATIRVSSWRMSRKEAEDKIQYIESHPPIVQDGNVIRIGRIDDEDLRRNVSISYDLAVPADTRLRSATGSGSQTIEGIHGPLTAETGSGSIRANNIGADVEARTGSGGIDLQSVTGTVNASTGSGSIHALRIAGGFSGHTGSGGVEFEQTAPGNSDIETGSGSIEIRGANGSLRVRTGSGSITAEGKPAGDWHLHSGSGGVTVHLPQDAAFELDARASSGRVETSFPVTVQGTISPRELHGKVRGGGPLLELSTSSGTIRIE